MTASLTLYDGLLIVAAAGIGVAAWRNRQTSGARSLAVIVIGVVVSALATLLVRISVTYETALLWNRVFYVGWSLIPVCLLVFTLEFTDREQYVTPRTLAALSVVPVVSVLAVWTNDAHRSGRPRRRSRSYGTTCSIRASRPTAAGPVWVSRSSNRSSTLTARRSTWGSRRPGARGARSPASPAPTANPGRRQSFLPDAAGRRRQRRSSDERRERKMQELGLPAAVSSDAVLETVVAVGVR